jgi:hypothetical protein
MPKSHPDIVLFAENKQEASKLMNLRHESNRNVRLYIQTYEERRKIIDQNRGFDKEIEQ